MTERFDVCVVGSATLELVATTHRHPSPGETVLGTAYQEHPGGKGLNQAVASARSGASTAFIGAIGTDAAGDRLLDVLHSDGIDAARVNRVADPTGRAVIVVDDVGENSIVVVPGANATVTVGDLPRCSVVLAQLEVPVVSIVDAFLLARAQGATTILNPAPATELPPELLDGCDILVPNEHEVALLGGADTLLSAGCGAVVVTRGGAGADVHTAVGVDHRDAFAVDVVDTTGAGDAFCGGLAARLGVGDDLVTAVRWATAAGALATTVAGAVPGQPTATAIERLLADQPG